VENFTDDVENFRTTIINATIIHLFDDNQIQSLNHSVRKSPAKKQSPMKQSFEAEVSDEQVAARIKFGKRMVCDSDDDCVSDE